MKRQYTITKYLVVRGSESFEQYLKPDMTWTSYLHRAQIFETHNSASAALEHIAMRMQPNANLTVKKMVSVQSKFFSDDLGIIDN